MTFLSCSCRIYVTCFRFHIGLYEVTFARPAGAAYYPLLIHQLEILFLTSSGFRVTPDTLVIP